MISGKNTFYLFCDGSFDPHSKIGIGAILLLSKRAWENTRESNELPIQTRLMQAASIARIELMTALWGFEVLKSDHPKAEVHLITDCKMIENLPLRRARLDNQCYESKRSGRKLTNADLYMQFFQIYDELCPEITWIKGHSPSSNSTEFQRVFALVDKKARRELRQALSLDGK